MSINLRVLVFYMSQFYSPLDFIGDRTAFYSRDTYEARFSKQNGSPAVWVWIQNDLFDLKRIEKLYTNKGQENEETTSS